MLEAASIPNVRLRIAARFCPGTLLEGVGSAPSSGLACRTSQPQTDPEAGDVDTSQHDEGADVHDVKATERGQRASDEADTSLGSHDSRIVVLHRQGSGGGTGGTGGV